MHKNVNPLKTSVTRIANARVDQMSSNEEMLPPLLEEADNKKIVEKVVADIA